MKTLPKGYIAVKAPDCTDPEGTFLFRGVAYAVTEGINCFPDMHSAAAASTELPEEILSGLPYEAFPAPVLLFSAGDHKPDKFTFDRSLVLLGQGAGISPNLPAPDRRTSPAPAPERTENESVLRGSYWFGKIFVTDPAVTDIVIDGFTSVGTRLIDSRKDGGTVRVTVRNTVHRGPCGNTLYLFGACREGLHRSVTLQNLRLCDYDGLDYGGLFCEVCADVFEAEGICYTGTEKPFGFTDMARSFRNLPAGTQECTYAVRNSYFAHLSGEGGIGFTCRGAEQTPARVVWSGCTFADASLPGEAPLQLRLSSCQTLEAVNCLFTDSRGGPAAIRLQGTPGGVTLKNCVFEGFAADTVTDALPPRDAPRLLDTSARETNTEDPHTVVTDADFRTADALYYGTKAYYGDLHVHTDSGGTSDGKTPIGDYPAEMDRAGLDFAAVVDHRQMRGFFLTEWDEEKFIIGTEPGTSFSDLNACRAGQKAVHYNMLFPHKYGLAMVLANFPEFEFHGDELTGSFRYPGFTKQRFRELTEYVQSLGGIMVHPHPKTMLASDDPSDYYFGEHMFLETIYGSPSTNASFKNYTLWCKLLDLGYHVYASGGSDSHGKVSNSAPAVFYSRQKSGRAFFDRMHSADFAVGIFGLQMCIDGAPMGSELAFREGQTLTLRVADLFPRARREHTAYEVRVITDRGLAYASVFDGDAPQALALRCRKRRFYRAEVFDLTNGVRVCVGNPIWLDREEPAGPDVSPDGTAPADSAAHP